MSTLKGRLLVAFLVICCLIPTIVLPVVLLRPKYTIISTQVQQMPELESFNHTIVNVKERFIMDENIDVNLTYTMAFKNISGQG
jgi:hypothetical protein